MKTSTVKLQYSHLGVMRRLFLAIFAITSSTHTTSVRGDGNTGKPN